MKKDFLWYAEIIIYISIIVLAISLFHLGSGKSILIFGNMATFPVIAIAGYFIVYFFVHIYDEGKVLIPLSSAGVFCIAEYILILWINKHLILLPLFLMCLSYVLLFLIIILIAKRKKNYEGDN